MENKDINDTTEAGWGEVPEDFQKQVIDYSKDRDDRARPVYRNLKEGLLEIKTSNRNRPLNLANGFVSFEGMSVADQISISIAAGDLQKAWYLATTSGRVSADGTIRYKETR